MVKVIFDTNMILRYLLNDNPMMYEKSKQLLKQGNIWVTLEVIAEVICWQIRGERHEQT